MWNVAPLFLVGVLALKVSAFSPSTSVVPRVHRGLQFKTVRFVATDNMAGTFTTVDSPRPIGTDIRELHFMERMREINRVITGANAVLDAMEGTFAYAGLSKEEAQKWPLDAAAEYHLTYEATKSPRTPIDEKIEEVSKIAHQKRIALIAGMSTEAALNIAAAGAAAIAAVASWFPPAGAIATIALGVALAAAAAAAGINIALKDDAFRYVSAMVAESFEGDGIHLARMYYKVTSQNQINYKKTGLNALDVQAALQSAVNIVEREEMEPNEENIKNALYSISFRTLTPMQRMEAVKILGRLAIANTPEEFKAIQQEAGGLWKPILEVSGNAIMAALTVGAGVINIAVWKYTSANTAAALGAKNIGLQGGAVESGKKAGETLRLLKSKKMLVGLKVVGTIGGIAMAGVSALMAGLKIHETVKLDQELWDVISKNTQGAKDYVEAVYSQLPATEDEAEEALVLLENEPETPTEKLYNAAVSLGVVDAYEPDPMIEAYFNSAEWAAVANQKSPPWIM